MKFAAIADVHGNCVAPEAVLADIAGIGFTEVVNLQCNSPHSPACSGK
jgi:hypothetical protein